LADTLQNRGLFTEMGIGMFGRCQGYKQA